jgi:hypothetical protein
LNLKWAPKELKGAEGGIRTKALPALARECQVNS